ncbi:hypothetical protein CN270_09305 [Priestia megaterium]|uniref:dsDNA nuclease domain-containing protein n=1 Tax=Priestia megaterium TaxID=1404 RepID=UPI000BF5293F|nr:dsDNA nuclease domain-containing protein [Priestia megaterium]PFE34881.1 hypothetical protein CN270_09305 [Priestia megaterium]
MSGKLIIDIEKEETSSYLTKKLDSFGFSDDGHLTDGEKKEILESLLSGDFKDLGGLVALRGFLYQYYVTMYYIIDMVKPEKEIWWESVIFEFFDDIALYGGERFRFIQVKTVREDGDHKITPSKLYSRIGKVKKKNIKENLDSSFLQAASSWVDKLFLNSKYFSSRKGEIENQGENYKFNRVDFELATNSSPQSLEDFKLYSNNPAFSLSGIPDDDKLKNELIKEIIVYEKDSKEEYKCKIEDLLEQKIDLNLKNFYINKLGQSNILEKKIEDKIVEKLVINGVDHLKKGIASYIFEKLLYKIILRTHKDHEFINKSDLVFKRREVEQWFEIWEMEAKDSMSISLDDDAIVKQFSKCFENIKQEIEQGWHSRLRDDLLSSLMWFEAELKNHYTIDNHFYYKFLNKLFELNNINSIFSLKNDQDLIFLKNSLKSIILCLAFYKQRQIPYKDLRMIFNHGSFLEKDVFLFSIYNARQRNNSNYVKSRILNVVSDCSQLSDINEEYFCIISDAIPDIGKGIAELFSITDDFESENTILSTPNNIKFINKESIEEFFSYTQHKSFSFQTFNNKELVNKWIIYLNQQGAQ